MFFAAKKSFLSYVPINFFISVKKSSELFCSFLLCAHQFYQNGEQISGAKIVVDDTDEIVSITDS